MQRILSKNTVQEEGKEVLIQGWINARRNMGKIVFLDLRDASGVLQVVCVPAELDEASQKILDTLRPEFVVSIKGQVQKRGEKQINKDMVTGTVEVLAKSIEILNEAKTLPFEIDRDTSDISEEVRMKYRYLDLRSERVTKNIKMRSDFVRYCREYLFDQDFTEIETPILTKSTPEGSRDFVVPSRLQKGKYFALPQSPQQYKQLLMTAGFEKYFQIARCLRDEDPRADRGFEHTQVDLEMSFVDQEVVMQTAEEMIIHSVEKLGLKIKEKPFPRITHKESMEKYKDDKFDLRTEEEKEQGVLAYAWVVDFPFFKKDEKGSGWTFTHNPFSQPKDEFLKDHLAGKNIENILTTQYDLICNGVESAGGSMRAHKPEVLKATYKTMGYSDEEIQESIGHILEAFEYGAPPHGGIAVGVERNIMNFVNEKYIREVQAFPMSGSSNTSVMDAPSELPKDILKQYGL